MLCFSIYTELQEKLVVGNKLTSSTITQIGLLLTADLPDVKRDP